jgi:hypothetical protein
MTLRTGPKRPRKRPGDDIRQMGAPTDCSMPAVWMYAHCSEALFVHQATEKSRLATTRALSC